MKLVFENISKLYGDFPALSGINLSLENGVYGLLGPNGAGKTTIMHALGGLIAKSAGSVVFDGVDITITPAHKLVSMGMAQVPEGRRIFQELTVYENLMMGAYSIKKNVTFTSAYMFAGCTSLEKVTFDEKLTAIGDRAFSDCPALVEITLPISLKNIGVSAFDAPKMTINLYILEGETPIGFAPGWHSNDAVIIYDYGSVIEEETEGEEDEEGDDNGGFWGDIL